MARSTFLRSIPSMVALVVLLAFPISAKATSAPLILPPPEPGSFFTVFEYARDGRVVAFDGFTVFIQRDIHSSDFVVLGTLPEAFRGGTDPAFIVVSPDGQQLILGGGAGGSKFPDPAFNGTLFSLPIGGGEATLLGTFPFSILGTFGSPDEFFFGQGETFGTFTGSVEMLDLRSLQKRTVVGNIPGDPGGVTFDHAGNLFVGLGAGQNSARTGEIHRFTKQDVEDALQTGVPLDFDTKSTIVTQILNAGDLEFDAQGDLFVGGCNFSNGSCGFIAQVDVTTSQVVDRFDPVDGDPNDGDIRFFEIATTPSMCRLGALDLFSFFSPDESIVFERSVCAS